MLRCNLSEIYSNVLISATDGGGAIDFRPSLSMEDVYKRQVYNPVVFECTDCAPFEYETRYCKFCGAKIDTGAEDRFCPVCKQKLHYEGSG